MIPGNTAKELIVNADDFGLTRGVNEGIIEAHRRGIVTSATLMANMPYLTGAIKLASDCPELGLGLHTNLTQGTPLTPPEDMRILLGNSSELPGVLRTLVRAWRPGAYSAIRREIAAQLEAALAAGARISHFDGHKHVHVHPVILRAAVSVAGEYGVRAIRAPLEAREIAPPPLPSNEREGRMHIRLLYLLAARARKVLLREGFAVADEFFGIERTGNWDCAAVEVAVRKLRPGVTEFMVHPGRVDDELRATTTRLLECRMEELNALVSNEVRRAVVDSEVELVNYHCLTQRHKSRIGQ